MNLYIVFLLIYSFSRERQWPLATFFVLYAVTELVFLFIYLYGNVPSNTIFGIILIIAIANEFRIIVWQRLSKQPRIYRRLSLLLVSIGCFVVGFIIWNVISGEYNEPGPYCYPDSWFQGHTVWHFLTALAMLVIFKYMQEERVVAKKSTMATHSPLA